MRVYWIGVFVCILSCLVIIIYLYKKNADYRTHDKWQFRLVFHFPQVLIALSIIFEIIATGVIFASKREVEKMSEEIQMEINAQKRKLDLYFRQQMEVSWVEFTLLLILLQKEAWRRTFSKWPNRIDED